MRASWFQVCTCPIWRNSWSFFWRRTSASENSSSTRDPFKTWSSQLERVSSYQRRRSRPLRPHRPTLGTLKLIMKSETFSLQWNYYNFSYTSSSESCSFTQYLSDVDIPSLSNETISENFSDQHARLVCLICYKIFNPEDHSQYKNHIQNHTKSALKRVKIQAKPIQLEKNVKPSIACSTCSENFSSRMQMWKHSLTIHGSIQCSNCDQTFEKVGEMSKHTRSHEGPLPKCQNCGKTFDQPYLLNRHLAAKVCQEESRKCNLCGKVFVDKTRLSIHMRLHNKEKPFECGLCKKAFTQKRSLTEHQLTHSTERKFSCEICDKKFVQKNHLKYHMSSIHKLGETHACQNCDKTFAFPSQLKRHGKIHQSQ